MKNTTHAVFDVLFRTINLLILGIASFLALPLLTDQEYLAKFSHQAGAVMFCILLLVYLWAIIRNSTYTNGCICILVLGAFTLMETRIALLGRSSPYVDDVFRSPAPYVQFTAQPGATIPANPYMSDARDDVHINEMGVRVEVPMNNKPPSEKRVVILGGSTVFNGTPLSHTIPGYLEAQLGGDYRVYNFGVVSSVSGQELDLLIHRVLELKPDLVITYDGGNDIVGPYNYDPRPGYPYNFMLYEEGARILQEKNSSHLLALLLKKSEFLSRIFKRSLDDRLIAKNRLKEESGYGSEAWDKQIIEHYAHNLQAFCTVAKGGGFRYAAFLQPMLQFKTPKLGVEAERMGDDKTQEYIQRQYTRASALFSQLSATNNDSCMYQDMSHSLENINEEIYWDLIHTSNRGNQIIAEKMHALLSPWLQHTQVTNTDRIN